jgi:hypothetical protein
MPYILNHKLIGTSIELDTPTLTTISLSRSAIKNDSDTCLYCDSATDIVLTIEDDVTSGWLGNETIMVYQSGAGKISFAAGNNVVIHAYEYAELSSIQFGIIGIMRVSANTWSIL